MNTLRNEHIFSDFSRSEKLRIYETIPYPLEYHLFGTRESNEVSIQSGDTSASCDWENYILKIIYLNVGFVFVHLPAKASGIGVFT